MKLSDHPLSLVQAVADLRAVASEPALGTPEAIRALGANAVEEWHRVRAANALAPVADGGPMRDAVMLAAVSTEEDPVGAMVATAMLLAQTIETRDHSDDWLWAWEALSPYLRSAPARVRAALMNGFKRAREIGIAADEVRPSDQDCLTRDSNEVLKRLFAIARSMTDEQRATVATYDYGQDVERQLDALNTVLAHPSCAIGAAVSETWFPSEVVELAAYDHEAVGFVPCFALVMIWTVQDRSYAHSNVGSRWSGARRICLSLPMPIRKPILDGVRHCYEGFDSFDDVGGDGHAHLDKTLPWFLD
ncbi:MAG: hypothetical protein AAF899_14060 [Pseudomonadota bacterium]